MTEKGRLEDKGLTKFGRNRSNGRADVVPAHKKPRRHIEVQLHSFVTTALNGKWSTSRSDHFTPGKKTRYPSNRRLGGGEGQSRSSGDEKNLLLVPGFDLATVQPNRKIMPNNAHEDSDHIPTLQHNTKV